MKTITMLFNKTATREEKEIALQNIRRFGNVTQADFVFPDSAEPELARIATVHLDNAFSNGEVLEKIRAIESVEVAYVSARRQPI